ncbi:hypothetical protein PAPYR_5098 [Paratrimastix pyriformis]|uniref:Right handed beta helix domain-containing protein n=1 Tax=Paratrimastix pyriformis TaxID=342808 RepID=A0ABQ8UM34_9EUKA|nr:hypothetical protein PAPYR_5098 [Paratrimastix pyriformis]
MYQRNRAIALVTVHPRRFTKGFFKEYHQVDFHANRPITLSFDSLTRRHSERSTRLFANDVSPTRAVARAATLHDLIIELNSGTYSGPGNLPFSFDGQKGLTILASEPGNALLDCAGTSGFSLTQHEEDITLDGIVFSHCNSTVGGGALYGEGVKGLTLRNMSFTNNTAVFSSDAPEATSGRGGAVLLVNCTSVAVTNATFESNTAFSGSALELHHCPSPVLSHVRFVGHRALPPPAAAASEPNVASTMHGFMCPDMRLSFVTFAGQALETGLFVARTAGLTLEDLACDRANYRDEDDTSVGVGAASCVTLYSVTRSSIQRFNVTHSRGRDASALFATGCSALNITHVRTDRLMADSVLRLAERTTGVLVTDLEMSRHSSSGLYIEGASLARSTDSGTAAYLTGGSLLHGTHITVRRGNQAVSVVGESSVRTAAPGLRVPVPIIPPGLALPPFPHHPVRVPLVSHPLTHHHHPVLAARQAQLSHCYFQELAYLGGAAIYGEASSGVAVELSTFTQCTSRGIGYGGAILSSGATVLVRNCTFTGNTAFNGAVAGVLSQGEFVDEGDCHYSNNTATYGGCIYVGDEDSGVYVRHSVAYNNSATAGGFLYLEHTADGELVDCHFRHNRATQGGVVYVSSDENGASARVRTLAVRREAERTFSRRNEDGDDPDPPTLAMYGCHAEFNRAEGQGGVLFARAKGSWLEIANCTMRFNHARKTGSVIYDEGVGLLRINGTAMVRNHALDTVNVHTAHGQTFESHVEMRDCLLANNTGTGLFLHGDQTAVVRGLLEGCRLENNTVIDYPATPVPAVANMFCQTNAWISRDPATVATGPDGAAWMVCGAGCEPEPTSAPGACGPPCPRPVPLGSGAGMQGCLPRVSEIPAPKIGAVVMVYDVKDGMLDMDKIHITAYGAYPIQPMLRVSSPDGTETRTVPVSFVNPVLLDTAASLSFKATSPLNFELSSDGRSWSALYPVHLGLPMALGTILTIIFASIGGVLLAAAGAVWFYCYRLRRSPGAVHRGEYEPLPGAEKDLVVGAEAPSLPPTLGSIQE